MRKFLIVMFLMLSAGLWAQSGPQLYNMSFDIWSKSGGIWYLCPKGTPAAGRVWDSANPASGKLGVNLAMPEYVMHLRLKICVMIVM